jgi:hypothetical protein
MGTHVRDERVSGARRLLSTTRTWPWGLALITDPGSSDSVPTTLDRLGIAPGRSILAAGIQHEVDGEAVAEVWRGPVPADGLTCVFDGDFTTVCGVVIVGDAAFETHAPADVGEGRHRLRVLVDEIGSPAHIVFEFDRPA